MATPAPAGTLSYPPLPGPIAGIYAVNAPWAQWFRELWNRVGGPDAPTNTELHTLIMSQAPGGPVDTATLLETVGDFFVQQGSGQEAAAGAQVADMSGRLDALEVETQDTAPALLSTLQRRLDDLEAFVLSAPGIAVPPAAVSTITGLWNWSTLDGTGDPGAPNAAFDTAALPLALRISRQTLDNHDASAMLATVQPGDMLTIQSPSVSTIWVRFNVNAALSHFPTYFSYPGTVLATGAGGQPTANMPVTLTLTRMAGLEDAGSDTETPFIRTALDLDNRVAALENLPLDSVTQSVNDLRSRMEAVEAPSDTQAQAIALDTLHKRLDDLEAFVLANQSAPAPVQALSTMTALWNWSTVDDPFAGDPGAPNAAFDVALAPLNLRVARRTLDNRDASAMLATVQPGDVWTIESPSVSTIWVRFEVNTALRHFPTYFTYPGTVLATGAGGQPTANMPVTLTLTRMAGLEDAGSDTETPFIRTALDLDNRVAALENLPLDSVTQSVNDLRSRMEAVEVLAMINLAPPVPPGVALLGYTNTFTQGQTINQNLNPHLLGGTTPVPLFGAGSILLVNAPDNVNAVLTFNGYGILGGNFAGTRMRLPGGLPGPLAAGNLIFAFQALGFDGAAYSATSQAGWETRARNLWSTTDHSTYYVVQTTPSGSVTPQNVLG